MAPEFGAFDRLGAVVAVELPLPFSSAFSCDRVPQVLTRPRCVLPYRGGDGHPEELRICGKEERCGYHPSGRQRRQVRNRLKMEREKDGDWESEKEEGGRRLRELYDTFGRPTYRTSMLGRFQAISRNTSAKTIVESFFNNVAKFPLQSSQQAQI